MKAYAFVFLASLSFAFAAGATAQLSEMPLDSPAQSTHPELPELSVPVTDTDSESKDEIEILKVRNALLERYLERLFEILYATLFFAATFLLGFLGLNWYYTSARYQRDQQAMRVDLEAMIEQHRLSGEREMLERTTKLEERIANGLKKIDQRVPAQVQGILDSTLEGIHDEIHLLQAYQHETESASWEARKIFSNAIRCTIEYIQVARKLRWEWMIERGLETLQRQVNRNDAPLQADQTGQINALLDSLDSKYSITATRIRQKL